MKFGVMAFSTGIFIQFGGMDIQRMMYVRCQIGYVWRGVYHTAWTWMAKDPFGYERNAA